MYLSYSAGKCILPWSQQLASLVYINASTMSPGLYSLQLHVYMNHEMTLKVHNKAPTWGLDSRFRALIATCIIT